MPWQETDPMIERRHFIQDANSGQWAMSELCVRYGVSRVTGYKWLERHQQGGDASLVDRSRRRAQPRVHRTLEISCERPIRSALVSFISLFGGLVAPLAPLACRASVWLGGHRPRRW